MCPIRIREKKHLSALNNYLHFLEEEGKLFYDLKKMN